MGKFKDDWKGAGTLEEFVEEANKMFSSLNNVEVQMPSDYDGIIPSISVEGGRLTLNMGESLIFTLNNVKWNLGGTAVFTSNEVSVINGQLVISVTANA